LKKLLLRYSAISGELEKRFGLFSNLNSLRKEVNFGSTEWEDSIIENYFTTLLKAKQISDTFCRKESISNNFLAIHQPFQNRTFPDNAKFYERIDNSIKKMNFVHNLSSIYTKINNPYRDAVHVNQEAKKLMANKISDLILVEMENMK
jgi:hypothetical protein